MQVKKAEFETSVASVDKLSAFKLPQIAFVGRSNVGKSSLINYLTNRNKLAKTSASPGRTRLINFFKINDEFYMVDLPGYGFAKAGKAEQARWQKLIGTYLEHTKELKYVFSLMDIRHPPTELDKMMVNYLYAHNIPFTVVATKADKLSKSQAARQAQLLANELGLGRGDIIVSSAQSKTGAEEIFKIIDTYIV